MSGLTDRLRQIAGDADSVLLSGEEVAAMLDVIDAAEQVHEYGFDCHGNLEDALAQFREVAS